MIEKQEREERRRVQREGVQALEASGASTLSSEVPGIPARDDLRAAQLIAPDLVQLELRWRLPARHRDRVMRVIRSVREKVREGAAIYELCDYLDVGVVCRSAALIWIRSDVIHTPSGAVPQAEGRCVPGYYVPSRTRPRANAVVPGPHVAS
ncbi:hypothetical protein HNR16_001712 [Pseudoclavibacter chungangensis]|nr:hypothetical protein [Pseudoclavibacter chungangensis]NYJ66924.1 hypothetical protein [Pseudoclavibacter chungangensis]